MKLYKLLKYAAETYQDQPAFYRSERDLATKTGLNIKPVKTYEEFMQDVEKCWHYYSQIREQRIALLGLSSYQWVCHAYGAVLHGKTIITPDPLLADNDLLGLLTLADTQAAVLAEEVMDLKKLMMVKGGYPVYDLVLPEQLTTRETSMEEQEEGHFIIFTSGTTGHSKAAEFTTDTYCNKAVDAAERSGYGRKGKFYITLPMYHMAALGDVPTYLYNGNCCMLGRIRTVSEDLQEYRPDMMITVPSILEHVMKHKQLPREVRGVVTLGGKCPFYLQQELESRQVTLENEYGSTETVGRIASNIPGDPPDCLTPEKGVKIHILNQEVCVETGDHIQGYYKKTQATADKFTPEGYIRMGDRGYLDEAGRLHLEGRMDDIVAMKNGEKVNCIEVDEVLNRMNGIEEAATIYFREQLTAVLVKEKDTPEDLITAEVEKYNQTQPVFRKLKKTIIRKEPLPRTASGKLTRWKLIQEYEKREKI